MHCFYVYFRVEAGQIETTVPKMSEACHALFIYFISVTVFQYKTNPADVTLHKQCNRFLKCSPNQQ